MGNLNKNEITINFVKLCQGIYLYNLTITLLIVYFTPPFFLFCLFVKSLKNLLFVCLSFFILYSPFFFFFILIPCLVFFIFFSNMCHNRCCLGIFGQPYVPSGSSFHEIMMNKDFWSLLFYLDKLSIALNATVLGQWRSQYFNTGGTRLEVNI